ncbi:ATP-dependent nuclease [Enterobacter mori]|uniref:ATP-dependent nuclease n=1 Tax=Enterobacter mori TaxID=539813 RepID=UPI001C6819B2|nr:AAA family ATPase [Enterobacter mori]MBW8246373.1 ATP-binding protein [Enterobacter mori]MBW8250688.1 ATP-binding protein [Enterobacter mori]
MKYRESQLDVRLRKWFENSLEHQLLRKLSLINGILRSLTPFTIKIDYPLLAIAGRNGAGKSTLLAMAACAFHSTKKTHILKNRKRPYYTFADFFIQHTDEVSWEGITIQYSIAHNNWKKTDYIPTGQGIAYQTRYKKLGGKWNRYDSRVKREVIFLGIERIVPHSEKSQSKSYSKYFKRNGDDFGWEMDVSKCVGYILDKNYDNFTYVTHSRYRLPIVEFKGRKISGFNMGAGENALFEIFSTAHACGEGALIIIDEIELGLHAEAQKRFIGKLKEVCYKRKLQIIFTTHSDIVFGQVPEDARVFIETINGKTVVNNGISPEYAFSKLSSENSEEVYIFVEDEVAFSLISNILPANIRSRVQIEIIGSAGAISRQLGALYQRKNRPKVLAIFDGDQRQLQAVNYNTAKSQMDNGDADFKAWFDSSISYLPGEEWPEQWLMSKCLHYCENLASLTKTDPEILRDKLYRASNAGKHKEVYDLSLGLGLTQEQTLLLCCSNLAINCEKEFLPIIRKIDILLMA